MNSGNSGENRIEIIRNAFRHRRTFREYRETLRNSLIIQETFCPKPSKKKRRNPPGQEVRIIGKNGKPIKVRVPSPSDRDSQIIECEPEKSENLISVGGLAGWNEEVSRHLDGRLWCEFRQDQFNSMVLSEKKNRRKKKNRPPTSDRRETDTTKRERKIRALDDSSTLWKGLT